jgi:hypothetical protein
VLGVILVVWVLVMRRWVRGWYDLYLLVVLVCVVGWMLGVAVVVWLWVVVLICVRDNPLVVGWLSPRHSIPGGLSFWAIPCWMHAVFAMKHAVIFARLLRPSLAPASRATAVALGGMVLTAAASSAGCWLAMLCTCC